MSETKLGMVLFCQNYVSMEVETNSKRRRVLVAEAVGKKKKKKKKKNKVLLQKSLRGVDLAMAWYA